MIIKTSKESKTYPKVHIPAGLYVGTFLDLKPSEDRLRSIFIVEDKKDIEGKPITLVYSAPVGEEYNPKTKMGQLSLALGFELGEDLNTDLFVSKQCQIKVEDYAKQIDGKVEVSSFVGEVFPLNPLE